MKASLQFKKMSVFPLVTIYVGRRGAPRLRQWHVRYLFTLSLERRADSDFRLRLHFTLPFTMIQLSA